MGYPKPLLTIDGKDLYREKNCRGRCSTSVPRLWVVLGPMRSESAARFRTDEANRDVEEKFQTNSRGQLSRLRFRLRTQFPDAEGAASCILRQSGIVRVEFRFAQVVRFI